MKIRLKYMKIGNSQYIGHLDMVKMFDRAFRRANINLKYSQGFNQRSQIVFALPSSVGVESKCEYLEFETDEQMQNYVEKLNNVLPKGFEIIEQKEVIYGSNEESLMAKVVASEYQIKIYTDIKIFETINMLIQKQEMNVLKKNKNGIEYMENIKPDILKIDLVKEGDGVRIFAMLKSGSRENLKPMYIIQFLMENNIDIFDYSIIREKLVLNEE